MTFVDYTDRNKGPEQVDVPDADYQEGPPEVDVEGRTSFGLRSSTQRQEAWKRWLEAGNDLRFLEDARALALAATTANPPGKVSTADELLLSHYSTQDVPIVDRNGETVDYRVEVEMYRVGPPDAHLGGAYDPTFPQRVDTDKQSRWKAYIESTGVPPSPGSAKAQRIYLDGLMGLQNRPVREVTRALRCLGLAEAHPWRTATGLVGMVALIATPVTLGLIFGLPSAAAGQTDTPDPPVGVAAKAEVLLLSGYRITVTWSAPATGPAPAFYAVDLTGTSGLRLSKIVDGTMTGVSFDLTDVGTFTALVTAHTGTAMGLPVAAMATIPPPALSSATTKPDPATGVTLTASQSATTGLRGITVAWVPAAPDLTRAPDRYFVQIEAPAVPGLAIDAGLTTSYRYDEPPEATYRASVWAQNTIGTSDPAVSVTLAYTKIPAAKPGAPRHASTTVFLSATTGKAGLTVRWDPPDTGGAPGGYVVTLTSVPATGTKPTVQKRAVGSMTTSITVDPLDDESFTVDITAVNLAGDGDPATVKVTFNRLGLEPDGIDWTPVFGADQVQKWRTQQQQFNTMDEKAFWPLVTDALEDKAPSRHGGLASYEDMLFVARLLCVWIDVPAVDPTEAEIADVARKLSVASGLPSAPPVRPFDDRLAVWRAAAKGVLTVTKTEVKLRHKLFGIVRCLERYLG